MEVYEYIMQDLFYRCRNQAKKLGKCIELQQKFMELYDQVKEKERQRSAENIAQRPFNYITCSNRRNDRIFSQLRIKRFR